MSLIKKFLDLICKNVERPSYDSYSNSQLKTEVIEVTPEYWTGKINRADGSVINVKVHSIENLLERCQKYNSSR